MLLQMKNIRLYGTTEGRVEQIFHSYWVRFRRTDFPLLLDKVQSSRSRCSNRLQSKESASISGISRWFRGVDLTPLCAGSLWGPVPSRYMVRPTSASSRVSSGL